MDRWRGIMHDRSTLPQSGKFGHDADVFHLASLQPSVVCQEGLELSLFAQTLTSTSEGTERSREILSRHGM